ncbi:MAG: hypothetical protein L0387_11155 [Acidobacteria bacterium]|nr:hypothetical protein [Acidobacteriota bacterium]MCI0622203.1 hypothetical protein [Acidobacteriota bacterium]MCI0718291.1 hypothetical protein [Acidobacteriota bacterium]
MKRVASFLFVLGLAGSCLIAQVPDNPEAIRHMQLAIEAHKSKRLDSAATEYEAVIKLAPKT